MPKRKKNQSDILNEQFDDHVEAIDPEDMGVHDAGVAEEFDEDALPVKRGRKETRLRKRAPLDATLAEGDYAAEPVSAASIDNIFSMFDDAEDAFDAAGANKINNEADYEAFLEEQLKNRGPARTPKGTGSSNDVAATGADAELLGQIEELRSRQLKLTTANEDEEEDELNEAAATSEVDSVRAVTQRLLKAHGQLVQLRVKLEPGVVRAVRVPQYYALDNYIEQEVGIADALQQGGEDVREALAALMEAADCKVKGGSKNIKKSDLPALYDSIAAYHKEMMKTTDATLEHWGSKLVGSTKMKAIDRPLLEQIRGVLNGRARLLGKVQRNRLHEKVFGHPGHFNATAKERALAVAEGDLDDELYDDSDFLRELIHRSGALSSKLQQSYAAIAAERELDQPKAKQGFHRKTKGKSINYEPRPKLVGFMMAKEQQSSGAHDVLLSSLFQ